MQDRTFKLTREPMRREVKIGIDLNGAQFLTYAKSNGVDFTNTAMIGRQCLYVSRPEMRKLLASCGWRLSEAEAAAICDDTEGYSEAFFNFLGATRAHSFDYSDYENATHTHDMNEPIPHKFKEAYTVVFDGGSLEHVFNFPVAIKNCMEMVKLGGHYLAITPANNFFGHGFYQFSPELYFTIFSEQNGFEITKIIAFEETANPIWYAVKSPRDVAGRVTLANSWPVFLLVIAKKIARFPIFEQTPQQSDYLTLWQRKPAVPVNARSKTVPRPFPIRAVKMILPSAVRKWLRSAIERREPRLLSFDPRFFERMDWPADRRT